MAYRFRFDRRRDLGSDERGSILMEFAIVFPIILTLFLAVIQLSHLWIVRHMLHYAAFASARSLLVSHPAEYRQTAERAAEQVLQWAVLGRSANERDRQIPGWGPVPGSGATGRKVRVQIHTQERWRVGVTVSVDAGMPMPIVGPMFAYAANLRRSRKMSPQPWLAPPAMARSDPGRRDSVPYPHIEMSETVWLVKPDKTLVSTW